MKAILGRLWPSLTLDRARSSGDLNFGISEWAELRAKIKMKVNNDKNILDIS
jgi:hypothetical protein